MPVRNPPALGSSPFRHVPSPEEAARSEFRSAMYELSDALMVSTSAEQIRDAVRHTWILCDLADARDTLAGVVLHNLYRDLRSGSLDRPHHAGQVTTAADRL